jgi:hypothetical protein
MARDEAAPFARGETFANGNLEILNAATSALGLGGVNLEGKEFVFEPNADGQGGASFGLLGPDPNGRPIRVRVVRNVSGVHLKPKRLVKYQTGTAGINLETRVDGYTFAVGDVPAGFVDEFLPAAGVPDQDLFYIIVGGTGIGTSMATGTPALTSGCFLVPGAGTSATNDDAGRVELQSLAGATTVLGANLQNRIGRADTPTTIVTASVNVPVIVHLANR